MAPSANQRKEGISLTIAASLLWSTSFAATGVGLRYTDPYTLVFLRFAVAGAALGTLLVFSSRGPMVRTLLGQSRVWILGGIYATAFAFQYLGQSMTSASAATVISNLFPIIVPLLAFFALSERVGVFQVLALALGVGGLLLFAVPDIGADQHSLWGDLALAATALGYAVFIVLSKLWLKGDSVDSSFAITLTLAPCLAVPLLLLATPEISSFMLGSDGWFAVIWMGTAGSIIPLAFYLKGLSKIPASLSGMILLSELIFGVILAMALLGEFLDLWRWAGTAAVCGAVLLASAVPGIATRTVVSADPPAKQAATRSAGADDASRTKGPHIGPAGSSASESQSPSSSALTRN